MNHKTIHLTTFSVRVGHWQIVVQAHNGEEAIQVARRHLSIELPRLYDLIRSLTAARFQVEAAA
jgi:hypothetical protein